MHVTDENYREKQRARKLSGTKADLSNMGHQVEGVRDTEKIF
jgi:hypothetical protein